MFNFYLIPAKADQLLKQGREIFLNQGNCASCHSLSDAKSDGSIGPNLNEIFPNKLISSYGISFKSWSNANLQYSSLASLVDNLLFIFSVDI